jgi:hypothetical protein
MQKLAVAPLVQEGFSVDSTLENGELIVRFSGNGDMEAVVALGLYLKQVHAEALELALPRVSCDFSGLYFMNSSCLKAFVTWIDTVGQMQPAPYEIRFLTNPNLHWQRRSLGALHGLAPHVVRIEAVPSSG